VLPGISKWAFSIGGEFARSQSLFGQAGQLVGAVDTSYRSDFSSSASYSRYLVVDGYSLVNARIGVRTTDGWALFLWSRNLLNKDYFELLTAAPGNTGLYVTQPGDARTVGLTLRLSLGSR
jgi:iron complex outermembrane recepter protein